MGLYLGWGMMRGMMSQVFQNEYADDVAAFKERRLSGPLFVSRLGGMLLTSLFNDELVEFSRRYYSVSGRFFGDYVHAFAKPIAKAGSMYVVADTWESQDHLSALLDQRFSAWQFTRQPRTASSARKSGSAHTRTWRRWRRWRYWWRRRR
jgi:hypothetical protein